MTQDHQLQKTLAKNLKLTQERNNILALPAEKALNAILESKQPATLIQSFPEEDLYFLMHDIGPEDFLPALSLASSDQWGFILDMEVWKKDNINSSLTTKWMELLFSADPDRFLRWMILTNVEFLDLYLFKNIYVRIREHDEEASDLGNDYRTLDDTFYFKFIDHPTDPKATDELAAEKEEFISKMLNHLAGMDLAVYQGLLQEASGVIPAEAEEELFRIRNVRMAEKGFQPFHEAMSIYQPMNPSDLSKKAGKVFTTVKDHDSMIPVPSFAKSSMDKDIPFTKALDMIDDEAVLADLQLEFANLCNQIISTEENTVREREQLSQIVDKACRYISIGMEMLTGQTLGDAKGNAAIISRHALSDLFKTGHGSAVNLKWKAEKWLKDSWFKKHGLPLSFWGDTWYGTLGGLFLKKPLYFNNYAEGLLYREFATLEEVKNTETQLEHVIGLDALFSLMTMDVSPFKDRFVTCKSLLLTLWTSHCLCIDDEKRLPAINEFKPFFDQMFETTEDHNNDPSAIRKSQITTSAKQSFLSWIAGKTELEEDRILEVMGNTLETIFQEIENEYGSIHSKDLNPELITLFCIDIPKVETPIQDLELLGEEDDDDEEEL